MSIAQFLRILLVRRIFIIVALMASILGGFAVIKMIPKQYEAKSRVLLQLIRPDPVTGEVIQSGFARAYTKTQMELIKDYRVAGRAVDKLGWLGSASLAEQYRRSGSDMPFRRWLAGIIMAGTDARLIEGSNILEIAYTGQSPDSAATIANALRESYEEQTVQFKRQDATKNARWFQEQTTTLRKRLLEAEARKAEFEKANDIILQDDNTDSDSARLAALASSPPPLPSMSVGPAATVAPPGPAQMQLAQIDAAMATASRTLGPNHPDFIAMQRQREVVANSAAQERAAAAANARAASAGAVSAGPSAAAQFDAQRQKVLAQRGKLAEAKQLQNDVAVLRAQLNETQQKAAQAEQEAQVGDAGLTLLGNATPPDSATFPKTVPVMSAALALGLGLGVMLALLVELLNRRVRGPEDLIIDGVPLVGMMRGSSPYAQPARLGRILRLAGPGSRGGSGA